MTLTLVLLVVALVAALGTGAWWHLRSKQKWQTQLTGTSAESAQRESEMVSTHTQELSGQRELHSKAQAEAERRHSAAIAEQHALYGSVRKRLHLEIGESTSREHIVTVCREKGLDAVIMSNVLFKPVTSVGENSYHAQVDHLVVTEKSLMIVESKYWKDATFDGVDLCEKSAAMRVLFEDLTPRDVAQNAVHLRRDGDRVKVSTSDPASQVRRQAQRLSDYLKSRQIPVPWIETCVYYCHPGGVVEHTDFKGQTAVVSTFSGLRRTIMRSQTQERRPVDVGAVVEALMPLSTDTTGTGAYSEQWRSILESHPMPVSSR